MDENYEPMFFIQGNAIKWTRSFDDYSPLNGWSLTYLFRGPTRVDINAEVKDSAFVMNITEEQSQTFAPGMYILGSKLIHDSETTINCTSLYIQVKPSLDIPEGTDVRTRDQIMLQAIRDVLSGRASQDALSYSIEGQSISKIPHESLLVHQGVYQQRVNFFAKEQLRLRGQVRSTEIFIDV